MPLFGKRSILSGISLGKGFNNNVLNVWFDFITKPGLGGGVGGVGDARLVWRKEIGGDRS